MENNSEDIWTEAIEAQGQKNVQNLLEYHEIEKQLKALRNKQNALKQSFKKNSQLTLLQIDPDHWNHLKNTEKYKKHILLALLRSKKRGLPAKLMEPNFGRSVPTTVLDDPDIFLARIQHPQFQTYHQENKNCISWSKTLFVNIQAMGQLARVVELYPQAMFFWSDDEWTSSLWNDALCFQAFLKGINRHFTRNRLSFELKRKHFADTIELFCLPVRTDLGRIKRFVGEEKLEFPVLQMLFQNNSVLRNDKDLVQRIFLQHSDGVPDDALKIMSKRLRDNEEVVRNVVQINGCCLKHAGYKLRKQRALVGLAVAQNARAVYFVLPPLQRRRYLTLEVMKRLLDDLYGTQTGAKRSYLFRKLYFSCKPAIRYNPEIVGKALQCKILMTVPEHLRKQTSFWKQAVKHNPHMWYRLEEPTVEIARSIEEFDRMLWYDVTSKMPSLMEDRELWMKCAKNGCLVGDVDVPRHILLDREIMLEACRNDSEFLEYLDEDILTQAYTVDRDFLNAAIDKCGADAIFHMTEEAQFMHPDLVARAINDFDETADVWELFDHIEEDCWMNREVCLAWVRKGGEYLHDEFPESLENDKELFKIIANKSPSDFWCASDDLSSDKSFMKEIVRINPFLFSEASNKLLRDFDVALEAFGGQSRRSAELGGRYNIGKKDDLSFLLSFSEKVRSKIACHMAFTRLLCGMQLGVDTPLVMLSQGRETALVYKKRIAEFLGVSKGEELRLLRKASLNLAKWGF